MPIRLRDLSQGALLHVVMALLAGPMKVEQIARKTGKSRVTVQHALETLDREFGLVAAVPDGRWPVWSLRDTSQLALTLFGLPGESTVDNSLASVDDSTGLMTQISASTRSSSSSSSVIDHEAKNLLPPVMTQISTSAEGQAVINRLTRLGATPGQAEKAITAALGRNEGLADISRRIAALAEYAANHRTIRNPGQWALGYITTGCDLPEDARAAASDYSGYRPYLATGEEGSEGGGKERGRKEEEGIMREA
jgi:hypothetical protein